MEIGMMFNLILAAFAAVLLFFLFGGIYFSLGKEGRFHMGRFFRRGGIDLIKFTPLSNELELTKIEWDGKYWKEGKDAIMVGLNTKRGISKENEAYNAAISNSGRWAGSKRTVLLATQKMFIVYTHGFVNMMKNAGIFERHVEEGKTKEEAINDHNAEYTAFIDELEAIKEAVNDNDSYPKSKAFVNDMLTQVQTGYEGLKIVTTVTADEISKYLSGTTSRVLQEARLEGKSEGALEMTEPKQGEGVSPTMKAIAVSASLVMALVIAYVAITGQNPLDAVKSVLPN